MTGNYNYILSDLPSRNKQKFQKDYENCENIIKYLQLQKPTLKLDY